MSKIARKITRSVTVQRTPRFMQMCGKFDLPTDATSVREWEAEIELPEQWHVGVITGPSMCLGGDTPIYDPIDGSTLPIRDRYLIGLPFHVLSLAPDGSVAAAAALPPGRGPVSPLLQVTTGSGRIVVTCGHRFRAANGEYLYAQDVAERLRRGDEVRLLTSEDSDRPTQRSGARRSSRIREDSPGDYHREPNSGDGRPLSGRGTDRGSFPSLSDVPGRRRVGLREDARGREPRHSRPCPSSGPPSISDDRVRLRTAAVDAIRRSTGGGSLARGRDCFETGSRSVSASTHRDIDGQLPRREPSSNALGPANRDDAPKRRPKEALYRLGPGSFQAVRRSDPESSQHDIGRQPSRDALVSTAGVAEAIPLCEESGSASSGRSVIVSRSPSAPGPTERGRALDFECRPESWKPPAIGDRISQETIVYAVEPFGDAEFYDFHVPGFENYWACGLFHHNCGKTTIANDLFPGELVEQGHWTWPPDKCIGDGFPESMPISEICGLLSSVGFSSPPDWKKPYAALSNGGKFRVDLARALAENRLADGSPGRAVIDEFGSMVHARARQVAAAAAAKAVRRRGGQLVALLVHDDAIEYFEADWVIRVQPGDKVCVEHTRGSLQPAVGIKRPPITLKIIRVHPSAWDGVFKHHHYLSHSLHRSARCFVGLIGDEPAAFTAVLQHPHQKGLRWREHRTVCLPEFQGIGIGNAMSEAVASIFAATGAPYLSTTSHPAMIHHRAKSPLWKMKRRPSLATPHRGGERTKMRNTGSTSRITAGFEYVGPANVEAARRFGLLKPQPAAA